MKEEGVIEGYTVELDLEALVEGQLIDALIEFETTPSRIDDVYNGLTRCEGAVSVMKTADSRVVARFKGDRETFEDHLIDKIPDAVTGYETTLITQEKTRAPPL